MLALLGAIFGLIGNVVPEFVKWFHQKQDNAQEIRLLELQIKYKDSMEKQALAIEELKGEIAQALEDSKLAAVAATAKSGSVFVDGLNSLVRPIVALSIFFEYCLIKFWMYEAGVTLDLWKEEDTAILMCILTFYFGGRGLKYALGRKQR